MSSLSFPLQYMQYRLYPADTVTDVSYITEIKGFYQGSSATILSPNFSIKDVNSMSYMFSGCNSLKTITKLDTSKVTNMSNMFYNCQYVFVIPEMDTSNVTDMSNMFYNCNNKFYKAPEMDTSNVTNMSNMFSNCQQLRSVPLYNTSKVTNMSNMLASCSKLETIPAFDTSNVTNINGVFQNCTQLRSVPLLDFSKITDGYNVNLFASTTMSNLKILGGFKDLGKPSNFNKPTYFLRYCPNLTKESVLNVLNNLYDRKTAGYSVVTLPFHTNSLALLTDEEKAIATNKGWTLATS